MNRLPSLNALRAFEAAARHETLMQAAEELHVTHGAVSRQVRALEQDLGEELFDRSGRGKITTERGRILAAKLQDIFHDLTQTLEEFRRDRTAQPLSVSCEPTLCLKMLIPWLGALKAETGLDIKVFAAGGPIEFDRDRIDLAVRRDDFPIARSLFVQPLAQEAVGPVISPVLLANNTFMDMRRVPELHSMTRPDAWQNWSSHTGFKRLRPRKLYYEHFYLALQAAQAGQGAALASVYMAASDIAAGLLIAPRGFTPDGTRYVCLSTQPFEADKRKQNFVSWLAKRMETLARDFIS